MPEDHDSEVLSSEMMSYFIKDMHFRLCDPKNPNCLEKQMEQLRAHHRVVLAVATFIGGVITLAAQVFSNIFPSIHHSK